MEQDQTPALICSSCRKSLTDAARLKKISLVADNFFRKQTRTIEENLYVEFKDNTETAVVETLETDEEVYELIEYDDTAGEAIEEENWSEIKNVVEEFNATKVSKEKPTKKSYAARKPGAGRQVHQCECGVTFSSNHRLRNHVRVKHEFVSESELLPCEICGKK